MCTDLGFTAFRPACNTGYRNLTHSEQSLKYRRSRLLMLCFTMIADAGTTHAGPRTHFSRKALRVLTLSRNVTD